VICYSVRPIEITSDTYDTGYSFALLLTISRARPIELRFVGGRDGEISRKHLKEKLSVLVEYLVFRSSRKSYEYFKCFSTLISIEEFGNHLIMLRKIAINKRLCF
jgi:hypothetical protein